MNLQHPDCLSSQITNSCMKYYYIYIYIHTHTNTQTYMMTEGFRVNCITGPENVKINGYSHFFPLLIQIST